MHLCHFDLNQDHDIEYVHILIEKRSSNKILKKKRTNSVFFVESLEIDASFLSHESDIKRKSLALLFWS